MQKIGGSRMRAAIMGVSLAGRLYIALQIRLASNTMSLSFRLINEENQTRCLGWICHTNDHQWAISLLIISDGFALTSYIVCRC